MDLASQVKWLQALNERLIALNEQLAQQRSADQEERRELLDLVRELSRNLFQAKPLPPPRTPRADLQEPPPDDPPPEFSSEAAIIPSGAEFPDSANPKDLSRLFMSPTAVSRASSQNSPTSSSFRKIAARCKSRLRQLRTYGFPENMG